VVDDAVDHHPLHFDSIAVKLCLHLDKDRILVLPLGAYVFIPLTKVDRHRFVHVGLPLVVAEHDLAVQLQLGDREVEKETIGFVFILSCACMQRKIHI